MERNGERGWKWVSHDGADQASQAPVFVFLYRQSFEKHQVDRYLSWRNEKFHRRDRDTPSPRDSKDGETVG